MWSGIVASFVIYFFRAEDSLFERIVDSGAKGLAVSYLESAELVPVIAGLIEKVVDEKSEKQKVGINVDFEEILQGIDFRDSIKHAQEVIVKIDQIDRDYDELLHIAGRAWRAGAIHIVAIIGAAVTFLFVTADWKESIVGLSSIGAIFTLFSAVRAVLSYDKKRSELMSVLKDCRSE